VINVDLGSYFHRLGPFSSKVNEFMLTALDRFPVQVFNLTADDLFMLDQIRSAELPRTRVISTNLEPPAGKNIELERFAILEIASSANRVVRVAFLGLVSPLRVKPNSGFRAADPVQAVSRVLDEIREQIDFAVVLGDIDTTIAKKLAQNHPEIYAVLCLERRFRLVPPEQVNNAVILKSIERGRYLGQLSFDLGPSGMVESYQFDYHKLTDQVPEDSELLEKAQLLAKVLYP
jgi:2',3'-cyclic-nucleotide 2'-phosphodiesterase (5'-nucleotidase family)